MNATLSMRDVANVCQLSDFACRKIFRDPALQNYIERPGPNGGRPRRFWRFASLAPVLRQREWFTSVMEQELAALDLKQRTQEND